MKYICTLLIAFLFFIPNVFGQNLTSGGSIGFIDNGDTLTMKTFYVGEIVDTIYSIVDPAGAMSLS